MRARNDREWRTLSGRSKWWLGTALLPSLFVLSCGSAIPSGAESDGFDYADQSLEGARATGSTAQLAAPLLGLRDTACVGVKADVPLAKRPVDIIFAVDNSGSMTEEIVAVQNNINTGFADIIARSGLDYRVIMVAAHGNARINQSICISSPLSTSSCSPVPVRPGNNPPRFYQYGIEIESVDTFQRLLDSYNGTLRDQYNLAPLGWSSWLRPEAYKVFVNISDDGSSMPAADFERALLAKTPAMFGDATNRNYQWNSIVGVKENTPATRPWAATDPLQVVKCGSGTGGAVNAGTEYQKLSITTGGLRFPICQYASFDSVFSSIASGVLSGTKAYCDFALPAPPPGRDISLPSVFVEYTPLGGGPVLTLRQVPNAAACTPNTVYIDKGRVNLCPDVCKVVQLDKMAKLQVVYDCSANLGSACTSDASCSSNFCVDGVCCESACGGGADGDCQVCSKAKGASADGKCSPVAAGSLCRAAAGSCDVPESCDGTSLSCPNDALQAAATICRAAAGACDLPEACTGTSAVCPADGLIAAGTTCRAAAGACDSAEVCSGTSAACPADSLTAAGTTCRPAVGACDSAETCSGTSAACPADALLPAATVCRAAAGPCDNAEVCSGTSAACPADKLRSANAICRPSAGPCDVADKCSGKSAACPQDKFQTNVTVCRSASGACDLAEFCSGTSAGCPVDQFKPTIAVCRPAAGACDLADYCTGSSPACPPDDVLAAGTVCRGATSACDQDEVCSGTTSACPADQSRPDGSTCPGGMCKAGICL